MQQRLVEHHAVIACLDLPQHLTLDLTQRLLEVRLLLRTDALGIQFRFIQGEAKELLRRGQQCKKHAAGEVQTPACADAVPWHRIRLLGVRNRLVALRNQIRNREPSASPAPAQVVIPVGLQVFIALRCGLVHQIERL